MLYARELLFDEWNENHIAQPSVKSKIPRFESYEEEAEFWDTHDTTEFEDEFEPVEVTFAQSLVRRGLTIPLDAQTIELLRRLSTLTNMPILMVIATYASTLITRTHFRRGVIHQGNKPAC